MAKVNEFNCKTNKTEVPIVGHRAHLASVSVSKSMSRSSPILSEDTILGALFNSLFANTWAPLPFFFSTAWRSLRSSSCSRLIPLMAKSAESNRCNLPLPSSMSSTRISLSSLLALADMLRVLIIWGDATLTASSTVSPCHRTHRSLIYLVSVVGVGELVRLVVFFLEIEETRQKDNINKLFSSPGQVRSGDSGQVR